MKSSFKKSDIIKYMIIALVAYLSKQVTVQLFGSDDDKKTEQVVNGHKQDEKKESKTQVISGTIQGHDYVDLGLSVKWATCNVGAEDPWDYGDYFEWGETKTKSSYITYGVDYLKLRSLGVVDDRGTLTPDYDAASANWGDSWRMPNWKEWINLLNLCEWSWVRFNGMDGYKVTGKNGNWIFLPATGYRNGSSYDGVGSYGLYWSSTVVESNCSDSYTLSFSSVSYTGSRFGRCYGGNVRPVTE